MDGVCGKGVWGCGGAVPTDPHTHTHTYVYNPRHVYYVFYVATHLPGEADDLHAVLEGPWDGVHQVGRADEEHLIEKEKEEEEGGRVRSFVRWWCRCRVGRCEGDTDTGRRVEDPSSPHPQTDRQTDRQADRQTDTPFHKHTHKPTNRPTALGDIHRDIQVVVDEGPPHPPHTHRQTDALPHHHPLPLQPTDRPWRRPRGRPGSGR